jgi:hypothetical protein
MQSTTKIRPCKTQCLLNIDPDNYQESNEHFYEIMFIAIIKYAGKIYGKNKTALHQRQFQYLVHCFYIMKLNALNKIGFDFLYVFFILPAKNDLF